MSLSMMVVDNHGPHTCMIRIVGVARIGFIIAVGWRCMSCGTDELVDPNVARGRAAVHRAGVEVGMHQEVMRQLAEELP